MQFLRLEMEYLGYFLPWVTLIEEAMVLTRLEQEKLEHEEMTGKEPNVTVNPYEVVALGAIVQFLRLETHPRSNGFDKVGTRETDGPKHIDTTLTGVKFVELCSDLLDRWHNDKDNLKDHNFTDFQIMVVFFSTAADGWTNVEINLYQVTSIDKGIGRSRILPKLVLAPWQVIRMVREAGKFGKEDMEKRDAIDTKNQANPILYHRETKVSDPVKEKVEAKVEDLKDAISGGSTQAIKDAMADLNQEIMYLELST
ncbi:hypothetical protein SO802_008297 [Lithocarpus litseifolius]|uniref:Uncharacterized protein n=1 Tax=Lithocarpus litseifolius TaxID=425828 RepID=A0AAW2D880_9ROSI